MSKIDLGKQQVVSVAEQMIAVFARMFVIRQDRKAGNNGEESKSKCMRFRIQVVSFVVSRQPLETSQ